jgi:hypothetical protein
LLSQQAFVKELAEGGNIADESPDAREATRLRYTVYYRMFDG